MSQPKHDETTETTEATLRELVNSLRSRAVRLELLDQLIASFKQESERNNGLADSLSRGLELVQQVVEEREAFFQLSLDMLCIATTDGHFHKVNRAFERALGYTQQELLSRPFFDLIHPDDIERTQIEIEKLKSGVDSITFDNRYRHKDGTYRWLNWTTPAPLPGSHFLYAVARDVTAQRQRDEQVLYLASHDALTGLVNRWRFNEELHGSFARLQRHPGSGLALLLLDLDHFKPINDNHGHQAGDLVLGAVAARLNAIKRGSDVLCRLGGDEFALLAFDADANEAIAIAQRMREEIVRPISLGDLEVVVDVSIGIAFAPLCATDVATLFKLADDAMYEAKRSKDLRVQIAPVQGLEPNSDQAF